MEPVRLPDCRNTANSASHGMGKKIQWQIRVSFFYVAACFQEITDITSPGIDVYQERICSKAVTPAVTTVFRNIHVVAFFQKIVSHFIVFRCGFCKTVTNDHHTFWRIRQILQHVDLTCDPFVFITKWVVCSRYI